MNPITKNFKPVILVFTGHYRPGFKAGGILRSIENLVDHLHHEFEFLVVTRDRDLCEKNAYPNIIHGEWQMVKNARVYYLKRSEESFRELTRIVRQTPHNLIYLNSFFEPLTVRVLINRKLGRAGRAPVVLAPRGEFAWASLRQKIAKKSSFIILARIAGLYRGVTWHASSRFEVEDIARAVRVSRSVIEVAINLPIATRQFATNFEAASSLVEGGLKVVFLARISPEKNLEFALDVVSRVNAPIVFHIIGPVDDAVYWRKCETRILKMPASVIVKYLGSIEPAEIMQTLGQYDLLLFPSGGENYAHVIAESLACGTPVMTSVHTPWRDLESKGLGWDFPLDKPEVFVRTMEMLAREDAESRLERRRIARENVRSILENPDVLDANRQIFRLAFSTK